jgi:hypothetical protein
LGFSFYRAIPKYSYGANYLGLPGSVLTDVGFPDLTWEKNKIFNVGLDFGFLNNRLTGSVEVYDRQTSSLIFNVTPPPTTGSPAILQNIGSLSNKGVEISLTGRPVQTKDFTWEVRFNFAHNKNRVTELFRGRPVTNGFQRIEEGHDINEFYLRDWVGVDPDNGKPMWVKDDTRQDTVNSYNQAAVIMTGKTGSPKVFGGFGSTLTYKGISLDFLFAYNFGNYVYGVWDRYQNSEGVYLGAFQQSSSQLQSWKKPGDVTDVPQIIYGGNGNSYNHSSRFLYKGDFIRLRDIQLAYALPMSVAQKLHLGSLSLYVRGTNLVTFGEDDRIPFDPEAGTAAQNNFDVFIPRTITGGIKIGL